MENKRGLLGIFVYLDDLLSALKALREARLRVENVYSPAPREEIQKAMHSKPSTVRLFTLVGGILGGISGVSLAAYAHLRWNLITSGKPILPWVPWVVVFFEILILVSVFFTVISMVLKGRMPRRRLPVPYDDRFTQDRFGVQVACPDDEMEKASRILKEAGAEEVHKVDGSN